MSKLDIQYKLIDHELDSPNREPDITELRKVVHTCYPDYGHLDVLLDTFFGFLQAMQFSDEVILQFMYEWLEEKEEINELEAKE